MKDSSTMQLLVTDQLFQPAIILQTVARLVIIQGYQL